MREEIHDILTHEAEPPAQSETKLNIYRIDDSGEEDDN